MFTVPDSGIYGASFISENANETLVIFPGNGFNLVPDMSEIRPLLAPKRNIFVMEYPGMGESKSKLTVSTLRESARRFMSYVSQRSDVYTTRIILYGFSLGGFVATEVASADQVDALILDSTAPDMQKWVDANVPVYAKAFVDINIAPQLREVSNIEHVSSLSITILFVAGKQDRITPPELMQTLFDAAMVAEFKKMTLLDNVRHGESIDHSDFKHAVNHFLLKVAQHSKSNFPQTN
nr:alpha/beta fold hydrolase [Alteromonas sp. ASW11-130]